MLTKEQRIEALRNEFPFVDEYWDSLIKDLDLDKVEECCYGYENTATFGGISRFLMYYNMRRAGNEERDSNAGQHERWEEVEHLFIKRKGYDQFWRLYAEGCGLPYVPMICSRCGACACDECWITGRCRFCNNEVREAYHRDEK